MEKQEAIDLLRGHSTWLAEHWSMSPEGREYKARFDASVDALAGTPVPVRYGCHCDLEPGMDPDGCVFDEGQGRIDDCARARALVAEGKGRDACAEWRPVAVLGRPSDLRPMSPPTRR